MSQIKVTELEQTIRTLEAEKIQLLSNTNNAVSAANYFLSASLGIDAKQKDLFPDGIKPKSLLWLWNNRKKVIEFIEFVIKVVAEVVDNFKKMKESEQQNEPTN